MVHIHDARERRAERGTIPPDHFIPAVEQSMLARPFTAHVLSLATKEWMENEVPGRLAVNCPPALLSDPATPSLVRRALAASAFPPERLVLEVTERARLDGVSNITERGGRLREMGFRIAVDDLGAGYSGLTSFAALEPDFIKLDIEGGEVAALRGLSRPVGALSFEYVPGARDEALACIDTLERLGPYRYNWSPGETMRLALPEWCDAAGMRAFIAGSGDQQGDIYGRLTTAPEGPGARR